MWAVRVRHARRFPHHVGRHEFRCGVRHVVRFTSPWRPCQPRGPSQCLCVGSHTYASAARIPNSRGERQRARPGCGGERGRTNRPLPERTPALRASTTRCTAIRVKSPPPYGSTSGRVLRIIMSACCTKTQSFTVLEIYLQKRNWEEWLCRATSP